MPRKLISRGCMIFNCDRRHGNFCCYDCGYRTTNGSSRCKNPCRNTPGTCGVDLPAGRRKEKKRESGERKPAQGAAPGAGDGQRRKGNAL